MNGQMNGAELLLQAAAVQGVEVCFANPGTTEMPLVTALDATPVRAVLGLFEGVCTGAADGYARMAGKPALTLLHLGPGLANGVANLHNARRARTPIVNLVGDHASWHRADDPPLNMAVEQLDATVSGWQRNILSPEDAGRDLAAALAAAKAGQIATLLFPHDRQLAAVAPQPTAEVAFAYAPIVPEAIQAAAKLLQTSQGPIALILGNRALHADGLRQAARVRAVCGCDLLAETYAPRIDRGTDLPTANRIPYFPEQAINLLERYVAVVLVDAREPVAFFGYENLPGRFLKLDQKRMLVGGAGQDATEVIAALADALDARAVAPTPPPRRALVPPRDGALTVQNMTQALALHQPANAIIINEGLTSGRAYGELANYAAPHTLLSISGGAIGWGIPQAVGAAIACPERPVIGLQADGSGMYTLQGLWTQAREGLNVTTLIASNRRYNILEVEMQRAGVSVGTQAQALTSLNDPPLDWVQLAQGMGVPGRRVETVADFTAALTQALHEPGPHLIEIVL
jgi:acetolactate synthase-1/2/3 large subunit